MFDSVFRSPITGLMGSNTELSSCGNRLNIMSCCDLYHHLFFFGDFLKPQHRVRTSTRD